MNLDRIGKYRVVGKIGKGAMGEVYKAQDPLLNRFVAVKTIAPALAADPDFRRRFLREAQSAAQLNHPNIVTIFDFGEEDGLTYMAMELLEGKDLKDVIRARQSPLGDKIAIMEQLCDGLGFAHAKGVVHRDLKPGNVHLQPNGQVKVLDFGLARLGASDMTRTGTVMGTPNYMSPEQVRGEKADARSDVFSLGAVFYELLSHHRPFEADSVHGVLFQILEQEPDPIRKWAPEVPPALVEVVEHALAKDPARRYADAREMGRALSTARDAIAGETVVQAGDAGSTLLGTGDATVVEPRAAAPAYGTVRGATALTLARAPSRAAQSQMPRTVRPDPTVGGGAATEPPGASRPSRALVLGGAGLLAVAAVAGVLWVRSRAVAPAAPATQVAREQVGVLTEALVTSQLELARADLANRDYAAAARRAEDALKLDATSAEAREVLGQARDAQGRLDAAASDARAAFARKNAAAASEALGRVMALDPRHPVVAELSGELNRHFRKQAEDGRRQAEKARSGAEQARAASLAAFAEGRRLSTDAEASFRREEFTVAAQKFQESRMAYERAQRESEEARVAAAPRPAAPPSLVPGAAPASTTRPAPTVAAALPTAPPTAAPTAVPLPSPSVIPVSPAAPPAVRAEGGAEGAVRRVISEYGRAIGSQDLALFRSLKPDLSADEEKRLREAFKAIKSQVVGITVDAVEIDGDRATVRVTRQDVVNGRPMKPAAQTFRLARSGGSWLIQSIGQ